MTATVPPEQLENAIIVASLAHQVARTPTERRQAWERLQALIAQQQKPKG